MIETFLTDKTSPLMVVNVSEKGDGGSGMYTMPLTFTQIIEELNKGKVVILKFNNGFYYIDFYTTTNAYFRTLSYDDETQFVINASGVTLE